MIVVAKKFIPTLSLANYYQKKKKRKRKKKKALNNVTLVKVSHGLI